MVDKTDTALEWKEEKNTKKRKRSSGLVVQNLPSDLFFLRLRSISLLACNHLTLCLWPLQSTRSPERPRDTVCSMRARDMTITSPLGKILTFPGLPDS
ncbi:hypothetical protein RRG08_041540 [Elysia crispata]|uniref:Uncharacterized protein n=1 Tax=Elysia crispata TaxID=231223 RepID=A0AAE0ZWA5_9GAST|nr:hypothetical protein RRG08_041540 [Elysia crispata]